MEYLVTFPIETAVNGAPGVRRVRSATAVGVTIIWVEFDWGEDIYRARQTVTERLNVAAASLPPGTSQPLLGPISSIMGEVLFIALTSDRHGGVELRTIADTAIRRRILAIPGVAQVTPIGGGRKQYQVLLSPEKLKAYQVSLTEVLDALTAANTNTSAGFRVDGGQEYLIQGIGRFAHMDEIRQTVVTARNAIPIYIGDLGTVRVGEALKRGEGSLNGEVGSRDRYPKTASNEHARANERDRRGARRDRSQPARGCADSQTTSFVRPISSKSRSPISNRP